MTKKDTVQIQRRTRETEIKLKLHLVGSGQTKLELEPYFLRHMLESLSIHGSLDLEIQAHGQDEHHLIEDVAICLGQAIRGAVPDLKIERFADVIVPMDDALVLVALDLIDRPYAQIELPDSICAHFLRSMALDGKFTLHVRPLGGTDPHHIIEAAFKGLGKALRQATRPLNWVSSAKGEVEWR